MVTKKPKAADTASEKPKTSAKSEPPKDGPEPALVFLERLGPYCANLTRPLTDAEKPKGVGAKDPISNIEIKRVVIPPGLFLLDGETFERCALNGGFKKRVEDQSIVILNDDEGEKWEEAWNSLRLNRCLDLIENSAHEDTLRALLEVSTRPEVEEALEAQLREIEDEGAERRNTRQVQRAAHRGMNRRSRTRRLLG